MGISFALHLPGIYLLMWSELPDEDLTQCSPLWGYPYPRF